MRLVIVESPFAGRGDTPEAVAYDAYLNRRYLRAAIRDCLARGESPYASHRMLTDALDDGDPIQRAAGIAAGFAWRSAAAATVVYVDRGVSGGMAAGIRAAERIGHPIEERRLPSWRIDVDPPAFTPAEIEACRAAADGLPPLAIAAVRAHLLHGAEKHGVEPGASRADLTPIDHWRAVQRHAHHVEGQGDLDLARVDPHSAALHLTAVVCRGLLALDGVLRAAAAALPAEDGC